MNVTVARSRLSSLAEALPSSALGPAPQASATPAVFQARGITKIYRMGEVDVPALREIDLDLYSGELVVLLGASGSGKRA